MYLKSIKLLIILFAFLGLTMPVFSFAEDIGPQCESILQSSSGCPNMSSSECTAFLNRCSAYYDEQSKQLAQDITKTSAQKNTLQNAINSLKNKISSLNNDIKQGKIMVQGLNVQISDTQESIDKTTKKIENSQKQLAAILRAIYKEDRKPQFVILLNGNLSDFFSNLTYLDKINVQVGSLLDNTKNLKSYLQGQQQKMEDNVDQLQKTIALQTLQKQENEKNKKQQDNYLKLTEEQYQLQIQSKKEIDKRANEIRNRIFQLAGIADTKAPTFSQAVKIAKYVQGITGVRPAFLLAILYQESGIGKNVGQCYVTNFDTGAGTTLKGAPATRVMNPKSIPGFVELTTSLNRDPKTTPVSCWIPLYTNGKTPYGWGGAMGPAQFIASTWNIYKGKVSNVTGKTANPWDINDSFLASGFLLSANGASSSEFKAAAQYYCGGNYERRECSNYANSVLRTATRFEEDIKTIGE